jgi:hypothetical protein
VVIGSSSLVFEPAPTSVSRVDGSRFYVIAWAVHPNLISAEVSSVLPKPKVPFVEGEPPLFLQASEIIHSKWDTLQYKVLVHILEVHNFTPPVDSNDDNPPTPSSNSSDSGGDEIPGSMHSSLQPWPRIYHLARRWMIGITLYHLCLSMMVGLTGLLQCPAPPRACLASPLR